MIFPTLFWLLFQERGARDCSFAPQEMFSFRARELAPDALRVLDMQDMHSLRAGEVWSEPSSVGFCSSFVLALLLQQRSEGLLVMPLSFAADTHSLRAVLHTGRQQLASQSATMAEILAHRPDTSSPDLLRELAAIRRCAEMCEMHYPLRGISAELEVHIGVQTEDRIELVLPPLTGQTWCLFALPRSWTSCVRTTAWTLRVSKTKSALWRHSSCLRRPGNTARASHPGSTS